MGLSKTRNIRLFNLASSLCEELLLHESPIQPEDLISWFETHIKTTEIEHQEELNEADKDLSNETPKQVGQSRISRLKESIGQPSMGAIDAIATAADIIESQKREIKKLQDLLIRCRPIVEFDAQMAADITRFSPLSPVDQAIHDSTETESEKLLDEFNRLPLVWKGVDKNVDYLDPPEPPTPPLPRENGPQHY